MLPLLLRYGTHFVCLSGEQILTGHRGTHGQSKGTHYTMERMAAGKVASVMMGICLLTGLGAVADAQTPSSIPGANSKEEVPMLHAKGTFEVKLTPRKPDNKEAESANLARMSIDKQFSGDLEATSKGEMLSAMTEVKGSAGYVALERVSGTLQGRSGTFVLQHNATMTRGTPELSIKVVPDSGTGQLVGLTGKMTIKIEAGKHFYEFDYALPETH